MRIFAFLLTLFLLLENCCTFDIKDELISMKNILLNLFSKYESETAQIEVDVHSLKNLLASLTERVSKLEVSEEEPSGRFKHHSPMEESKSWNHNSPLNALRTCAEIYSVGLSSPGQYFIDPDGAGDLKPIKVNCRKGITVMSHDSTDIKVKSCEEPGCFVQSLRYSIPKGYIQRIAALSNECQQRVTIQCQDSKLINLSWWTDIKDEVHYYWSGNGSLINRSCSCGLTKDCKNSSEFCNCDASDGTTTMDDGLLTNSKVLPVMKVNFGGVAQNGSTIQIKIGPLECWGKKSLSTWTPTSCQDLWLRGQTHPGYYVVKNGDLPQLVFCELTKIPEEVGFERSHGTLGDLRHFVAFDVSLRDSFYDDFRYINFSYAQVNTGKHFNLHDGTFNVPRSGTYLLSVHGLPSIDSPFSIQIQVNQMPVATISNGQVGRSSVGSSILYQLTEGDELRLYNFGGDIYGNPNERVSHNLHFIGFLIHGR